MDSYADSSFVVSSYLIDVNSHKAAHTLQSLESSLPLTTLLHVEVINALNLGLFRKSFSPQVVKNAQIAFERDCANIIYKPCPIEEKDLFSTAIRLSQAYSPLLGNRSLDILHVASALCLGCTHFLTFDQRQAKLARKVGLKVRMK